MMIMAQHPQQPKHQQQQQQQQHERPNAKTRHQSAPQQQAATETATATALKSQQRSNSTEAQPNSKHLQQQQQHQFDGKRSLIKNQLYLIEQLQLENANLRNERDHLQLENEELKFQLQMISYSNILSRPAPTPLDAKHMEQLEIGGDSEKSNRNHLRHQCYAGDLSAPLQVDDPKSIGIPSRIASIAVSSQLSNQVELLASHFKKPKTRVRPEQEDDEQVSPYPGSESPSPPHESASQRTSRAGIPSSNDGGSFRHSSTNAIANQSLHSVIIEDNDDYPNHNHGLFMNDDANIDGTTADHPNSASFKPFGYPSPTGLSDKKSHQLATGASQLQQQQQQSADQQVENAYIVKAGGPPQSRDLPQDDDEQRIKLVEQRYGDSEQVQAAAITIQRAFRKYQICKRFRTITEQLRHTYQSSTATTTNAVSIKLPAAEKRRSKDASSSASDGRPISTGSEKSIDVSFTTNDPQTQQQRTPATWESLGCAAERLVAAAASMKQILPTAINGIVKTPPSQHPHQQQQLTQQVFYYPSNGQPLVAADVLDHHLQRPTQVKLQTRTTALENNRQLPLKQDSVVEAAISFQQLESMRKRQYRVGLNIFNKHPEKGVSFLVAHAFIDSSAPYIRNSTSYNQSNQFHFIDKQHLVQPQQPTTDQQHLSKLPHKSEQSTINTQTCQLCYEEDNLKRTVAHFLLHRKGLAKEKIGQYLGNLQEPFNQDVLRYYLQELDFYGLEVDVALRKFLSTFRLPGEAQKIEKIVDCFASRYVQNQQQQQTSNNNVTGVTMVQMQPTNLHPVTFKQYHQTSLTGGHLSNSYPLNSEQQQQPKNNSLHLTKDEIFILTFAIIMLNTDLHSPSLKSTSRMSASQFVNNLRGVFKSRSIKESDLIEIYERVRANQITTTPDHVTHVMKVQQSLTITNFQRKKLPNFCVPHRRLVCFCRLFEIYDVNKKEKPGQHQREIFLFNDLLLVTKLTRRARANSTQLYTYRQSISLQGLYVQLFQTAHYHYGIRLCQRSNDETIIMFNARNELDCSRFADDLGESIAEMDEMEIIKAHDIVDTIHFKYLKRLRRHANLHNPTENSHYSQRDQQRNNQDNNDDGDDANKSDYLEGDDASTMGSRDRPKMRHRGCEALANDDDEQHRKQQHRQPPATKAGTGMKGNSKFSSMFNLSNVMSLGGAVDAKSAGSTSSAAQKNSCSSSSSAKGFMAGGLTSQQPLQASPPGHGNRAERHNSRGEPGSGSESTSQRRCSTISVHSLDSGLFLSRDVSPNQSS